MVHLENDIINQEIIIEKDAWFFPKFKENMCALPN